MFHGLNTHPSHTMQAMGDGLSEEEAMAGFLKDLEKVTEEQARAALREGDFKGKDKEVAALDKDAVMEAFKAQSMGVRAATSLPTTCPWRAHTSTSSPSSR